MSHKEPFTRGVLYSKHSALKYKLTRMRPTGHLSRFIETYWFVSWDLPPKQPHSQQNIPDPCLNLVFEKGKSRIVGAVTKRFQVELVDSGEIFGIKFRPGGFYPFTHSSIDKYTDASIEFNVLFGNQANAWVSSVIASSDMRSKVTICEEFLSRRLDGTKHSVELIEHIIGIVKNNSLITKVEQLVDETGISHRSMQRLFKEHVGVSPKWIIRKHRIQEVLSRLEQGEHNWQFLVHHLDYFDQAHFIKEFKQLVGVTPSTYIDNLQRNQQK
ncbi:helix-turn-helix domain-containing protein [Arenicella sp. 4NH20-0111]|uniref:AraC family transcriptional regulator n=1 Tax=Arenicella sp. 4NH20-0111 TaxID=3127648 RepID=UPI00310C53CA